MILRNILQNIDYTLVQGTVDIDINLISYDSRVKMKNGLFICIDGYTVDGHKYAPSAIYNGAIAVVIEKDLQEEIEDNITIIKVENSRKAMAQIAVNYYENPSSKLEIIGVTGTNGKTTITHIISDILEKNSKKTGIIGTIENKIGNKVIKSERTTPESLDLQRIFADMYEDSVTHVAMEVSSHALALDRVMGVNYKVGIFSNLSQDHLDFHKTFDDYVEAKSQLFNMCETSIINIDDKYASQIVKNADGKVYTFGIDNKADFKGSNIKVRPDGVVFDLEVDGETFKDVYMPITGKFSVYNALAAIAALNLTGMDILEIISSLKNIKGVPGRFQSIPNNKNLTVIVDYAHTPDGLENILTTVSEFATSNVIVVFGCGGDRDKSKRPIMGEIAGRYADYAIITSDNPRSEDPNSIIDDIEVGIKRTNIRYDRITDREEAIKEAISVAKPNDVIIISGKGHEDYQILKDRVIHFDDVEIANKYLWEEYK